MIFEQCRYLLSISHINPLLTKNLSLTKPMHIFKPALLLISFFFIFGCSSADCTKTITIPELTISTPSGSSTRPAYDMEVPCDYKVEPIKENNTELKNFTYEVLNFTFTPDTGKNTSRLQIEIKLNNPNNFKIEGYPSITLDADGTISTGGLVSAATIPCYEIDANSNCIFTFDKESSHDLGLTKSIKLVSIKYLLFNK